MKFNELLSLVGDEPLFESAMLLAGDVDKRSIRRQLSLWSQSGRLHQLRRGVYMLADPYRKVTPHPFLTANRLVRGSYVSCQSALAHYGLIPEHTPTVISVTRSRPGEWQTAVGRFVYRHISMERFWGYSQEIVIRSTGAASQAQTAFVAAPEKALLDLIYLQPGADDVDSLQNLRLQHLDRLDLEQLQIMAERSHSPKLQRAAQRIGELVIQEEEEFEAL